MTALHNKIRSSNRWLAAVLVTLVMMPTLTAAQALDKQPPMLFSRLTLDNGLSQSNVLAIAQDADGMMWFGTENGLNRFDGYEFTHFKRERGNPNALSSDFVFDIAVGAGDALWLATNGGGVARLNRETGAITNFGPAGESGTSSAIVRRLTIDAAGRVWMATRDAGLDRLDPATGKIDNIRIEAAGEQPDKLFALAVDSKGLLWVGGDHGVTAIDTRTGQQVAFVHDAADASSVQKGSIRAIVQTKDGSLWFGSYGGGLSRLAPGARTFEHFTHAADDEKTLTGDRVTSILEDNAGRLWVGTTNGLNLVAQEDGSVTRYTNVSADVASLSDNNITSLFEDRSGLLWVGTKMKGLNTWNPRTWGLGFEPAEAMTAAAQSRPNVTSFVGDDMGRVWVGTFGDGLTEVDR